MGVFDDVKCNYPLPWPEAQRGLFQSKCTPAQYCEQYEIKENGELWYHKRVRKFVDAPGSALGFQMETLSEEWVREDFTGEIEIYSWRRVDNVNYSYSVQFWFRDGIVRDAVFDKHESSNQSSNAEAWR